MRVYKDDKIVQVICNKCEKQIKVKGDIIREGVFLVDYKWDYFSNKDGIRHSFDICEDCYNNMIKEFKIPVKETEYTEYV